MKRVPWIGMCIALIALSGCTVFKTGPAVLYHETFSGETAGQWSQRETNSVHKHLQDGRYLFVFKTSQAAWDATVNTQQGPFDNFRVDVEISHISGQGDKCAAGVLFRFVDWDNYYGFRVGPDGTYSIWKMLAGEWSTLVQWTTCATIQQGAATNTVTVRAEGSSLVFLINGQQVHQLADTSFASGRIGVYARTFNDVTNASMAFESILVTELE